MSNFEIQIPNERKKTYNIITFIILSLNFFGFGFAFLKTNTTIAFVAIVAIIINAVPWLYYLLNKRHIKWAVLTFSLVGSAFIWFYFGNYYMAIALIIFAIMGFFTNKKSVIIFSDDGITYPSFPVKKYEWGTVSQVIFKDDILTIDFKNNKLLQFTLDKFIADKLDAAVFNLYCANKIAS